MWKIPAESDLNHIGSLFAADAFIRQEYVEIEIYDLIQKRFENHGAHEPALGGAALVRGSSGTGKSAFLQVLGGAYP
jgi:ABC-type uncharacterized transport system fused permease/ATPase subunit